MNDSTTRTCKGGRVLKTCRYLGGCRAGGIVRRPYRVDQLGSNEWKVVSDEECIKIFGPKAPGYSLMKYSVNVRFDSELSKRCSC